MPLPLLKQILITKGGKLPKGLNEEEVDVVDENALDETTLDALSGAAGGGEELEGDEEGLEGEELEGDGEEETPSALEGVEATSASLVEAAQYVDDARSCADTAEKIAETISDAQKPAEEARAAAEEAAELLGEVQAAASDPDSIADGVAKVREAYDRAVAACEEAKAFMPDIDLGGDEDDEEEMPAEPTGGGLLDWAQQKAGE